MVRALSWLPLGGIALVAAYLVVESLLPGTLTRPRPLTIPEAIVMGNGPRALEMIAEGLDMNARALVRPGVFDQTAHDETAHDWTPLEAAILSQRLEIVRLLVRSGADVSHAEDVRCLAETHLPDALPILGLSSRGSTGGSTAECRERQPNGIR
jgi:hypothetical protein